MESNQENRIVRLQWLNNWRANVKVFASGIFSPPYLPGSFIIVFLITNLTQIAVMFMNQPLQYWAGNIDETGVAYNGSLLETSFQEWIIFGAIYLGIAIFCLTVFNYRWSLIGWLTAEAIHISGIQSWLTDCSFGRWSAGLDGFCKSSDGQSAWIIWGLLLGLFITSSIHPSGFLFQNKNEKKGFSFAVAFIPVLWIIFLATGVIFSHQKPEPYGWAPVSVEFMPDPLSEAEAAYDTKNNELVMFGGVTGYFAGEWNYKSDTWVWDGEKWFNMHPNIYPTGRSKHAMAYDENRGVVVLFGGFSDSGPMDDTWEWNGSTWANHCTCIHPSARFGHEMFYDPARQKVVLYGGYDEETEFNDAWAWDGEGCRWDKIDLGKNPPTASYFSLVRNPDQDSLLAVLSEYPGGTWELKNDQWTKLPVGFEADDRVRTTTVYIPTHKEFMVFGGKSENINLNDTWLFNGDRWTQYVTQNQPSIRSDMVIWYDQIRARVMLFGGSNGNIRLNDMWEFVYPEK